MLAQGVQSCLYCKGGSSNSLDFVLFPLSRYVHENMNAAAGRQNRQAGAEDREKYRPGIRVSLPRLLLLFGFLSPCFVACLRFYIATLLCAKR